MTNQVRVSEAWLPAPAKAEPKLHEFKAIWDTGATNTCITQAVIDACGLLPTGMVEVHGVHGSSYSETYLVNVYLPNRVVVPGLRVTRGELGGDADLLIGMDIINMGDFAVTNKGGVTKFSFRYPSQVHIDFVEDHNKDTAAETAKAEAKLRRSNLATRSKRRK